jgi:hypothetical protein
MEASEYFSEYEPIPRQFDVWVEKTPDEDFYIGNKRFVKPNFNPIQYFVNLNGVRLGLLHCEVTADRQVAYVDGIDAEPGVSEEDLTEQDWHSIAICINGLTKARCVDHPAGQTPFLEAL